MKKTDENTQHTIEELEKKNIQLENQMEALQLKFTVVRRAVQTEPTETVRLI